jgi:hypothetical protein
MKASKIATPTAPRPQINVTDKHFDEGRASSIPMNF